LALPANAIARQDLGFFAWLNQVQAFFELLSGVG
jgi:hypothetical protein